MKSWELVGKRACMTRANREREKDLTSKAREKDLEVR